MTTMTTTTQRTRRNERGTFATEGAVAQDGSLPIYDCTTCGAEVVWATSRRTGRKYLVNVRQGESERRFYMKNDLHRCSTSKCIRCGFEARHLSDDGLCFECLTREEQR